MLSAKRGAFVVASARMGGFVTAVPWLVPLTVADGAFVARGARGLGGYILLTTIGYQSINKMKQTTKTMIEVRSMKVSKRYVTSAVDMSFLSSGFGTLSEFRSRLSAFFAGTGSWPHEPHGWQRPIRFNASQLPASAP